MRRVAKNFGWLAAATILGQVIGFVVLAVASRELGPQLMGAYAFALGVATYIGVIANVGVNLLGSREVAQQGKPTAEIFNEVVVLQGVLVLTSITVVFLGRDLLATSGLTATLMMIGILGLGAHSMSAGWLLQAMGRSPSLGAAQLLGQVVYGVLAFFLLTSGTDGIIVFAWINVAGAFVATTLTFIFAWKSRELRFVRVKVRALRLRFAGSVKVGIGLVVLSLYFAVGPVALGYLANNVETGYYSVAQKIPFALTAVATMWVTTWLPHASRLALSDPADLNLSIEKVVTSLTGLGIVTVSILAITSSDLMSLVFGQAFEAAGRPFAILMAAAGILAISGTISAAVIAYKGDSQFSVAVCIAGLIAVLVTLGLVPFAGATGAAVGALAAEVAIFALMARQYRILSGRSLHVPFAPLLAITGLSVAPALALTLLYSSASPILTLVVGLPGWLLATVLALRVRPGGENRSGPVQESIS